MRINYQTQIYVVVFCIILWIFMNRSPVYLNPNLKQLVGQREVVIQPSSGQQFLVENDGQNLIVHWFLGLHNIHTQYVPVSGTVESVKIKEGDYHLAYHFDKSQHNYKIVTTILTKHHARVQVEQLAGYFTPKIDNYVKANQQVTAGQKLGHIWTGSRVILRLPLSHYSLDQLDLQGNIGQIIYPKRD